MEKPQKNYYAIIPANVRYDDNLIPSAKLLYGEITALCNEKGFCWAGDGYFAEQYGVGKATIQKWLRSLEKAGYINREVKYREGTREIEHRYITIRVYPILQKECTPTLQKERDNTTSFNTTVNTTNNIKDIASPKKSSPTKSVRHKYGTYENVLLSDVELDKLKSEFPNDWESRIEQLSEYVASTGKVYKNFLATIRNWAKKDNTPRRGNYKPRYQNAKKETLPDWVGEQTVIPKAYNSQELEERLRAEGKLS